MCIHQRVSLLKICFSTCPSWRKLRTCLSPPVIAQSAFSWSKSSKRWSTSHSLTFLNLNICLTCNMASAIRDQQVISSWFDLHSRLKGDDVQNNLKTSDNLLQEHNAMSLFGLKVSSDLPWEPYIQSICMKAAQRIGSLSCKSLSSTPEHS